MTIMNSKLGRFLVGVFLGASLTLLGANVKAEPIDADDPDVVVVQIWQCDLFLDATIYFPDALTDPKLRTENALLMDNFQELTKNDINQNHVYMTNKFVEYMELNGKTVRIDVIQLKYDC